MSDQQSKLLRSETDSKPESPTSGHEQHCFVVMPSGREPSEQKWFRGWYEVVIKAAVKEAGYEPVLAAAEEQPGAINDEIRTHLAADPMVVVDLGGAEPEDDPNPNVMYELGIRHALGLPLVMMAWKGQRLPFDVGNQRVIMEDRDLIDLDSNRKKLVSFIHAAKEGRFYRPMDAVSRLATIQAASESLAEDSLLRALAQEVKALRVTMTTAVQPRGFHRVVDPSNKRTVKRLIRGKVFRQELYPYFVTLGGKPHEWNLLLKTQLPTEIVAESKSWGADQWKAFISSKHAELGSNLPASEDAQPILENVQSNEQAELNFDLQLLKKVKETLPEQPWPNGVHKKVAETLGITKSQATKYMQELIRRGEVFHQIDGTIITGEDID